MYIFPVVHLYKLAVCVEFNGPYGFPSVFSQCFLHDGGFVARKLQQQYKTEGKDKNDV